MSSTRDQLEASLRARCDHDTLAVYADFLQSHGDPRGELIALDLNGASSSVDIEKRRGQLLKRWLGEDFEVSWDPVQRIWYAGELTSSYATFACGFVDLFISDADYTMDLVVAHLLAAPAGEYMRRLTLAGPTAMLSLLLEVVASRKRGWLQHLAISRPLHETPLLVGDALAKKLVAATPNLDVLDVKGRNMLGRFTHPTVRELGVTGSEAIELGAGPPLPALHTIDFALDGDRPMPRGLFSPERVPALRRLSLAREGAIFELLGTIAVAPQLTHLVLQSLRSQGEVEVVQAAIDRMPMLREVTIAHAYSCFGQLGADLRHTWARVRVAEPWPWRPTDEFRYGDVLVDSQELDLNHLVDVLEEQYDELPEDVRSIWQRFWYKIDSLDAPVPYAPTGEQVFHAGDLATALDALVPSTELETLRDELHRRIAKRGVYFATIRWD
jgi:uncharacterized protein (TIGR02996 family)